MDSRALFWAPLKARPFSDALPPRKGPMELQTPSVPHTGVAAVVVVCTMGAMDVYLVEQSAGARRLGVGALALAGDLFLLLVLRYAALWVGGEPRVAQRGHAMLLWFLFAFALEIKLYFIYQHYATEGRAPDPLARRTLTLLLSICIPALYTVLGAAELMAQAAASFRKKDELRGRLFWAVLDMLDVLEIQASLWEPQGQGLPLWAEGLTFFYCYGLLLVLPCVSLSELGVPGPRPGPLYPLLSLAGVNVASTLLRGGFLLLCRDQRVSSVFMGKNVLAIALKTCTVVQHRRGARAAHHARARGGQSLRHTEATGEELRGHTRTPGEACHREAAPDRAPDAAPATPGQGDPHAASQQWHRHAQAKAKAEAPQKHPWDADRDPHGLSHGHTHTMAQPLHRHCHARGQAPHHYVCAAQPSPRAPPAAGPATSRGLRAGHHVQLKSLWGGP